MGEPPDADDVFLLLGSPGALARRVFLRSRRKLVYQTMTMLLASVVYICMTCIYLYILY